MKTYGEFDETPIVVALLAQFWRIAEECLLKCALSLNKKAN
jgi:hypothetical protein